MATPLDPNKSFLLMNSSCPEYKGYFMVNTWAKKSKFRYSGSVKEGTTIIYGKGFSLIVSASQYSALLKHFQGRIVDIGTSRTNRPAGSVGEWLQFHVTKTAIASYVGPILIVENCAEKVGGTKIRFK